MIFVIYAKILKAEKGLGHSLPSSLYVRCWAPEDLIAYHFFLVKFLGLAQKVP